MPKFSDRCCNPINLEKHFVKTSLRKIPLHIVRYYLSTEDRICSGCYKKLLNLSADKYCDKSDTETPESFENEQDVKSQPIDVDDSPVNTLTEPTTSFEESPIQQSSSSLSQLSLDITLSSINEALLLLNESPIPTRKMNRDTYLNNKVTRVAHNLKKALGVGNGLNDEYCE
ncbi:hypothetical protein PV325_008666 [Microctonus aethiopoides]|uniref:Uncharacterized protein n=1 Tax=Microctonus aethiopoides TaxID=144406 RepID=A0AA39KWW8_9HYME|nr:hypothetical protein PV325_008666 [Microctonus aethiopoides]KAK0176963.1 hypothetical protein PV328_001061 [Microctonus aethiopoides]